MVVKMGNILKKGLQKKASGTSQQKHRRVIPNHLISDGLPPAENPNSKHLDNRIKTTKYTVLSFLPKNIFEQFHRFANLYFIFVVLLNWVPQINAFGKEIAMIPVIFVLSVTAIKDAYEDYRRLKSDKKINHLLCRVYSRQSKRYMQREWQEVKTGDIVHLSCNEIIPADMVLLRSSDEEGYCHIDTSNIDGENNLKQRHIIRQLKQGDEFHPTMFTHTIECDLPNMEIYQFNGVMVTQLKERIPLSNANLLLRGCIIRNTDFVEGIVVYAGHDTKALLNNRGPRYKRSKLERLINRDVIWCIVLLFLSCFLCSVGTAVWLNAHTADNYPPYLATLPDENNNVVYAAFLRFWTFIILFQVLIPLSLYVTVEIVKIGQVYFIERDRHLFHEDTGRGAECRALNITEELGQVQYVFSDKTGTLTENKMIFKQCSIHGVSYGASTYDESLLADDPNMSRASLTSTSTYGLGGAPHDVRLDVALASIRLDELTDLTEDSPQDHFIQEFFLLMAICNTVVVSTSPHVDQMDEQGVVHEEGVKPGRPASGASVDVLVGSTSLTADRPSPSSLAGRFLEVPSVERYTRLAESTPAESPPTTDSYTNVVSDGSSSYPGSLSSRLRFPSFRRGHRAQRFENEESDGELSTASTTSGVDLSFTSSSVAAEQALKRGYEAESPDELALVHAACSYRCRLVNRSVRHVVVNLPGAGNVTIRIMHVLPFDSHRKRMSVIIEHPATGDIVLYTKGADSTVFSCLRQAAADDTQEAWIRRTTEDHLTSYAKQGFRTLCMAKKVIQPEEYKSWLREHMEAEVSLEDREQLLRDSACSIEKDLQLLGATGIEDKLQDGAPETILAMRQAGVKVWVLTGDKQETALNVAHSCNLISFKHDLIVLNAKNKEETREALEVHLRRLADRPSDVARNDSLETSSNPGTEVNREVALIVDGRTLGFSLQELCAKHFLDLTHLCSSVICCRVTPIQKAEVVKLVRDKLKKVTLAIGDGANDVSMIQTADVGVGIAGQEGMQAVMSSDFALARFRFLKRMMFVHGHWCYDRLAKMALYMWYKNSNLIFVLMWYQFFTGFSGQGIIDDMNLIVFNLLYTSLPPIIMGIFDQCVDDNTLMSCPHLYRDTQGCEVYKQHSYWITIADSVYQSIVMFFIPYGAYFGSNAGIWEVGITIAAGSAYTNLLHFCVETKHWNYFHLASLVLSLIAFLGTNAILDAVCVACGPRSSVYGVFRNTLSTSTHWLSILLVATVSILPRVCVRALQGSLCPSRCVQVQRLKHEEGKQQQQRTIQGVRSEEPIISWSSSRQPEVSLRVGRARAALAPDLDLNSYTDL